MSIVGMIIVLIIILFVFGASNYYIAHRLYQWINLIFPNINLNIYIGIYTFIALLMLLGFMRSLLPIPLIIKNMLGWISAYYMGIFVYLLIFLVVADLVLLVGSLIKIIPTPIPQSVRFFKGLIIILLTAGTVSYGIYNANRIKHVSYDVKLKENALTSELKIVLISDLHLGAVSSERRIENMVRDINDLKPDIVCISGDIFDDNYYAIHNPDKAIDLFKSITATYGVYASLGNHDGGSTLNEMIDFLEKSNIKLLNDEHVIIDERLVLIGRLDSSPIGGFGDMSRKNFAEVISQVDVNLPIVVMDHNPASIGEYGREVDLILSGHTHRGQIFPGNLFTRAIFVVDYGHYQKDADSPHVVVTSGVGVWGMPMRVGTNSEIVSIVLH